MTLSRPVFTLETAKDAVYLFAAVQYTLRTHSANPLAIKSVLLFRRRDHAEASLIEPMSQFVEDNCRDDGWIELEPEAFEQYRVNGVLRWSAKDNESSKGIFKVDKNNATFAALYDIIAAYREHNIDVTQEDQAEEYVTYFEVVPVCGHLQELLDQAATTSHVSATTTTNQSVSPLKTVALLLACPASFKNKTRNDATSVYWNSVMSDEDRQNFPAIAALVDEHSSSHMIGRIYSSQMVAVNVMQCSLETALYTMIEEFGDDQFEADHRDLFDRVAHKVNQQYKLNNTIHPSTLASVMREMWARSKSGPYADWAIDTCTILEPVAPGSGSSSAFGSKIYAELRETMKIEEEVEEEEEEEEEDEEDSVMKNDDDEKVNEETKDEAKIATEVAPMSPAYSPKSPPHSPQSKSATKRKATSQTVENNDDGEADADQKKKANEDEEISARSEEEEEEEEKQEAKKTNSPAINGKGKVTRCKTTTKSKSNKRQRK